mmetsp:Transcript_122419/g.391416  ORF Transcript_122419/g.391416 Transcript_122419/m.391416 type:complete len:220 (-) Transcript_122419:1805-2464(-)
MPGAPLTRSQAHGAAKLRHTLGIRTEEFIARRQHAKTQDGTLAGLSACQGSKNSRFVRCRAPSAHRLGLAHTEAQGADLQPDSFERSSDCREVVALDVVDSDPESLTLRLHLHDQARDLLHDLGRLGRRRRQNRTADFAVHGLLTSRIAECLVSEHALRDELPAAQQQHVRIGQLACLHNIAALLLLHQRGLGTDLWLHNWCRATSRRSRQILIGGRRC